VWLCHQVCAEGVAAERLGQSIERDQEKIALGPETGEAFGEGRGEWDDGS
jgi:hypothetical protein